MFRSKLDMVASFPYFPPVKPSPLTTRGKYSLIELYTGIICACLPSLRIVSKFHFPSHQENDQESALPRFDTFSASDIDPQQQRGHRFSSVVDNAYESGQSKGTEQSQSSSGLPRELGEDGKQEKGSNASVEVPIRQVYSGAVS